MNVFFCLLLPLDEFSDSRFALVLFYSQLKFFNNQFLFAQIRKPNNQNDQCFHTSLKQENPIYHSRAPN